MEDLIDFFCGESKTHELDLPLFKELGLKPFKTKENGKEIFVGEYKLPDYEIAMVKIFVTCMPAQFWRIEILTDENKIFVMETGSGSLSEYWKTIKLVATGMIEIKEILKLNWKI